MTSKLQFIVINNDEAIGLVYKHESLGRVLILRGNINPEFDIVIHPVDEADSDVVKDIKEFILETIPNE
jgi:hypothetical protein